MNNVKKRIKYKSLVLLHLLLAVYSFVGVLGKKAAMCHLFSLGFIIYYSGLILLLFFYAICWQQLIKRLPLSVAYANKAVMIIWGMMWGKMFFEESIIFRQIIGSIIVIFGIILYANSDK